MKKGFRGTGTVERVDFPNKGIAVTDDGDRVIVKNTIPGQKVEFVVNKVKHQRAEGRLMDVIEKSPLETEEPCPHFGMHPDKDAKTGTARGRELRDRTICKAIGRWH